jgi:TrmH family RNA methyltransferase
MIPINNAEYHALQDWLASQDLQKEVYLPKASLRWIQTLHHTKERQANGILIAEGPHAIQEAITGGFRVLAYFSVAGFDPASLGETFFKDDLPPFVNLSNKDMARLATTETPPVCLALIENPKSLEVASVFEQASSLSSPLALILDGLQDPGNVGTLIRSAVAFDASAVITTASTVDCFSPKVIRSSAGLVFRLPIIRTDSNLTEILIQCPPSARLWLTTSHDIAPDGRQVQPVHTCAWTPNQPENPTWDVLILGNEGAGLTALNDGQDHIRTQWLKIPTAAACESLNVAVAGSILLASRYQQVLAYSGESPAIASGSSINR